MLGKLCLKYLLKVCKMKRKGIFVRRSSSNHLSGLQEAPQFTTPWASSCPAATRYKLTPQQSIPTTACSAVVRESQCGQVWQFLGAYTGAAMLAVWQWLVPWPTILCGHNQAGLRHGWCPSRAPVCLSCREPGQGGRLRWRALLWRRCAVVYFFWHCMMHHTVLGCCMIHMQQPPSSLFPFFVARALPSSPWKFWLYLLTISMQAPDPSPRPRGPFCLGSQLLMQEIYFLPRPPRQGSCFGGWNVLAKSDVSDGRDRTKSLQSNKDQHEHTELRAKLLDHFLRSNKHNINQFEIRQSSDIRQSSETAQHDFGRKDSIWTSSTRILQKW